MNKSEATKANKTLALHIGKSLFGARHAAGATQKGLAAKMNTGAFAIQRAESGKHLPSLAFIQRAANALGKAVSITLTSRPLVHIVKDGDCPECKFPELVVVCLDDGKLTPLYFACSNRCGWIAPPKR